MVMVAASWIESMSKRYLTFDTSRIGYWIHHTILHVINIPIIIHHNLNVYIWNGQPTCDSVTTNYGCVLQYFGKTQVHLKRKKITIIIAILKFK